MNGWMCWCTDSRSTQPWLESHATKTFANLSNVLVRPVSQNQSMAMCRSFVIPLLIVVSGVCLCVAVCGLWLVVDIAKHVLTQDRISILSAAQRTFSSSNVYLIIYCNIASLFMSICRTITIVV
jgi:hypothetical protein